MQLKEISEKKTWDEFVTNSYPTSFFQSWNWGEFQISLGNEIKRFGFYNDDGQLLGAAQGVIVRAKRGNYLYIRNGPVIDWTNLDLVDFVVSSLKEQASNLGLWHIRISPHVSKDSPGAINLKKVSSIISKMTDVDALDTWILDLTKSEEEILENMRKSTRYEIRKAERENVKIITSTDPNDIDMFYPIYEDTVKRQNWQGYTKQYIRNQFEIFLRDNSARLYLAEYNGTFIAGSIFIYYGNSSNYHYSGSLTEFRKIPAPALIQWENIKYSKSIGLKRYNFWGISPLGNPNHPWKGLSFFKIGFGGFAERWLPTRDILISPIYWLTYLYEIYDKWRKGY